MLQLQHTSQCLTLESNTVLMADSCFQNLQLSNCSGYGRTNSHERELGGHCSDIFEWRLRFQILSGWNMESDKK